MLIILTLLILSILVFLSVRFIPGLILGTALSAATMRMTRTMMLEVLRQDYIRTAWSKGLKEKVVVIRHAIKNALIPVVSLIGLQLPILVGGAVIMENIFNLPGIGRLLLIVLNDRDYPVVSGINLFFAAGVMGINLLIDLIYPCLSGAPPSANGPLFNREGALPEHRGFRADVLHS